MTDCGNVFAHGKIKAVYSVLFKQQRQPHQLSACVCVQSSLAPPPPSIPANRSASLWHTDIIAAKQQQTKLRGTRTACGRPRRSPHRAPTAHTRTAPRRAHPAPRASFQPRCVNNRIGKTVPGRIRTRTPSRCTCPSAPGRGGRRDAGRGASMMEAQQGAEREKERETRSDSGTAAAPRHDSCSHTPRTSLLSPRIDLFGSWVGSDARIRRRQTRETRSGAHTYLRGLNRSSISDMSAEFFFPRWQSLADSLGSPPSLSVCLSVSLLLLPAAQNGDPGILRRSGAHWACALTSACASGDAPTTKRLRRRGDLRACAHTHTYWHAEAHAHASARAGYGIHRRSRVCAIINKSEIAKGCRHLALNTKQEGEGGREEGRRGRGSRALDEGVPNWQPPGCCCNRDHRLSLQHTWEAASSSRGKQRQDGALPAPLFTTVCLSPAELQKCLHLRSRLYNFAVRVLSFVLVQRQ